MHFSKLRLSGFKSFVDPTDFRIEPGLTGIVGPNGCGKSNLLEGLRWVMGANSAKALRGEGMDDVIFSGSADRPARNHAEATLTIDNADHDAPAEFNIAPVLEIVRRIDRGEGSQFRINGREVRARDVQRVFADASTGANSPALVRQGQISELIAARPQNRRRILEEAAGVSGLHNRRHDVELRVRGAETNLARLDDVLAEVEASLGRLRREARHAERYRKLAAEIRSLHGILIHARWAEASLLFDHLQIEASHAGEAVETATRAAAQAMAAALEAEERIKPAREGETAAAAVLHRLSIDRDRLERALEAAASQAERLVGELGRIDADAGREAQIIEDAARAMAKLEVESARLASEIERTPRRLPELQAAAADAEAARSAAEGVVEALAAEIAAAEARALADETRLEEARSRHSRTLRALAQAQSERAALGPAADPRLEGARADVARAQSLFDEARRRLAAAEEDLASMSAAEEKARDTARAAEDGLHRLVAEARGLAGAGARSPGGYPAIIDIISAPAGLEAALAAALGDDLEAATDPRAPRFFAGRQVDAPPWPAGATPLSPRISAPLELAATLTFTGLIDRQDGDRAQALLAPGAALVSLEGDLWRWDGLTVRAEAPRPAQIRLEQKARLADIEGRIEALGPAVAQARDAHLCAAQALSETREAARVARAAPAAADLDLARARDILDRLTREGARRESRAQSLDETIGRFELERDEAAETLAVAQATAAVRQGPDDLASSLAAARAAAAQAREAAGAARGALDLERHETDQRRQRLDSLTGDQADWSARAAGAARRRAALAVDRATAEKDLAEVRAIPATIESRRAALLDDLAAAQARQALSGDVLAQAETARAEADRASRAADAAAADAREARATLAARLEAARERVAEHASAVVEVTGLAPQDLAAELAGGQSASALGPQAMEERLSVLEREREALGAVNLRAEEEAGDLGLRVQAMRTERADLAGALIRLRQGLTEINAEGRRRLTAAFEVVNGHFRALFTTLFDGGQAELRLVEADDPLEAGLEIFACPPGKRMAVMSLMSGGEQALTAVALIFAVFLANPAPVCFLDEVDAPLDDANVERFCDLLHAMCERASTRFIAITHNPLTMSRMDRLFGVTMPRRGVSQLVSVDLRQAEALAAE